MKEKNTTSPSNRKNTLKILTFAAILLLLGIVFWSTKWTTPAPSSKSADAAAISLWLWGGNATSSAGLSAIFKRGPDLQTDILETGFLSEKNEFTPSDTLHTNLNGAARIKISNIGKNNKRKWHLEAELPTRKVYTYTSNPLAPLNEKESKVFLLTFDQVTSEDLGIIVVRAVLDGDDEKNLENNVAEAIISVVR